MLELIRQPILHGELPGINAVTTSVILVGVLFFLASLALYKLQKQLVFRI
jgi:ABC-type polysaccharide/polyol phosphate export permease